MDPVWVCNPATAFIRPLASLSYYIHFVLTPNALKCKSSVITYSAVPFFTKEAIKASAMGTFRFARRRLPAIKASFSLNGIIFNPFSFSTIILVFAASSPILAPAYLINSLKQLRVQLVVFGFLFQRNSQPLHLELRLAETLK